MGSRGRVQAEDVGRERGRAGVGRGPLNPKTRAARARASTSEGSPASPGTGDGVRIGDAVRGPDAGRVVGSEVRWVGNDTLRPFLKPIADLIPDADNVRRHSTRNIEQIRASLEMLGQHRLAVEQLRPDGSRVVRVGNGMLEAAIKLGWTHLAVDTIAEDDTRATLRAISDNRAGELAGWFEDDLADTLAELESIDANMPRFVGFNADEFAALRSSPPASEAPAVRHDDAPPPAVAASEGDPVEKTQQQKNAETRADLDEEDIAPPALPVSATGDLWAIGPHRLKVGDSTIDADVDDLLRGERVHLVVTDPPYAIYGSSTGIGSDIADDKMVRPFFERVMRQIERNLAIFSDAYVFTDWRSWAALWDGANRTTMKVRNCIIWDKGGGGKGAAYTLCHEFVAYLSRKPPATAMKSNERRGLRTIMRPNVIRANRVTGGERQHNAAKPVDLAAEFIRNSSEEGHLVLDLFAGSASIAIAAHRLKRRCVMMEAAPRFADVSIKRLAKEVGEEAVLVSCDDPDGRFAELCGKSMQAVAAARGAPV